MQKFKRKNFKRKGYLLLSLLVAAAILLVGIQTISARTTDLVGDINNGASLLPNGQIITPTATPGSSYATLATGVRADGNADAAEAVSVDLSPDGKTLLVLTSGYNLGYRNETTGASIVYPVLDPTTGVATATTTSNAEWVFVFDVSSGTLVKKQQINIPRTYIGLRWAPDGQRFYVSGGSDDRVYIYRFDGNQYVPDAPFVLLGHNANQTAPFPTYNGGLLKGTPAASAATGAAVAGIATSRDGSTLFAANFQNDSLSIVDTATREIQREIQFFKPGDQVATGEFPFDVAVYNNPSTLR